VVVLSLRLFAQDILYYTCFWRIHSEDVTEMRLQAHLSVCLSAYNSSKNAERISVKYDIVAFTETC
jgi:hypothetical protein